MTGLAAGALAATGIGTGIGAYSSYRQGIAAQQMAEAESAAQLQLAEAQAAAHAAQAGEYARQAGIERKLAGVDQIQGELEAEKRSKALAAEIGATYANAAGNGVIVDSASPTDTFAHVLDNVAEEGSYDISIIRDNTAMNVWQRSENARKLDFAARAAAAAGANALQAGKINASLTRMQGENARSSGIMSALGQTLSGIGSLGLGGVTAYKSGLFSGSGSAAVKTTTASPFSSPSIWAWDTTGGTKVGNIG